MRVQEIILSSADVVCSLYHTWIIYNGFESVGEYKSEWQQKKYEHQKCIYFTDQFPAYEFDDAYANIDVWTQPGLIFFCEDIVVLKHLAAICEWMIELRKGNRVQFILQILERSRGEII